MVPALSLWLPIVLSAVGVFVVSSIVHMFLPWHRGDFSPVPNEDAAMDALRPVPPGDYIMPYAGSPEAMKDPAFIEKRNRGPVVFMTVYPLHKATSMGPQLMMWFLYSLIVSLFAAYMAGRAVGPGADYLEVFRFAGTSAFGAYSLALMQNSIWYGRRWSTTLKSMLDGFLYACITAGFFGWLWPGM